MMTARIVVAASTPSIAYVIDPLPTVTGPPLRAVQKWAGTVTGWSNRTYVAGPPLPSLPPHPTAPSSAAATSSVLFTLVFTKNRVAEREGFEPSIQLLGRITV